MAKETSETPAIQPPSPIPNSADGVKAIVGLARESSGFDLINLPTSGLGEGVPASVPLLIDRKPGGNASTLRNLIESYRLSPARREGQATANTLQSLIDLVNRHKDSHTAIFARSAWPEPGILAVIDYHQTDGTPRHCKHKVFYEFPVTSELKAWIEADGQPFEQAEFAAFLEEHAAELTSPFDGEKDTYERLFKERLATPMELVSLSRSLEVHVGAKAKQAIRLQTGERVVEFVEEHMNSAGEKVDIPGAFMIQVQAFIDGNPVRIPARLRYRLSGGTIKWFYQLYRWEFWLRERVQADLAIVREQTGCPAYEGRPEA